MKCLYFSGEESAEQLVLRADRLGISSEHLLIANESALESMEDSIRAQKPQVVVIDSIQTAFSEEGDSLPGSLNQVRHCANRFMRLAKELNVVMILVGHITKDGYLAGPKMLEHLVDTVLYLEGDRQHQVRLMRAVKNRFGATSELGVYEMTSKGLQTVENPSELFLDPQRPKVSGSVVVSDLEGNRTFFLEVQALVSTAAYGNPQRNVTGFDLRRLQMLLAVLERRAGYRMGTQDVFINVVGGFKLDEPAADLGIAAAIVSGMKDRDVDPATLVLGEVGLGGEVRGVQGIRRRVEEAARLGFKRVLVPERDARHLKDLKLEVIPVNSLQAALDVLF
jgi:DNA repair protein RadA/Sms